jgi:hypothetical protein
VSVTTEETAARTPDRRPGRFWLWYGILLAALLLLVSIGFVALQHLRADDRIPAAPQITVSDLAGGSFLSARQPIGPLGPSGQAVAHRASPLGLGGDVYTDPAQGTQPMALPGVPFTFLVPQSWGCDTTTAPVHHCADPAAGADSPALDLQVEHCPASCSADRAAIEKHLPYPVLPFYKDPYASVGDQSVNGQRYYRTLVDVFTVSADEPLRWLVVVRATASPDDGVIIQRIVNDIYAQTRT